jgi:hypothetical protein
MEVWPEALKELGTLVAGGRLKYRETIAEGIAAAPERSSACSRGATSASSWCAWAEAMDPRGAAGEEFRDDLRPLGATGRGARGSGNARRGASSAPRSWRRCTRLDDLRSAAAVLQTVAMSSPPRRLRRLGLAEPVVALSVLVVGVQQHALFILAHERRTTGCSRAGVERRDRPPDRMAARSRCAPIGRPPPASQQPVHDEDPDTRDPRGYPRGAPTSGRSSARTCSA